MITTDKLKQMTIEIMTGKTTTVADTAEEAAVRKQLRKECAEIVAAGGIVDVPEDFPDIV